MSYSFLESNSSDSINDFIRVEQPREIARLNQFHKLQSIRGGSRIEYKGETRYVQPRFLENQRPRLSVFEYAQSSPHCCPTQYTNSRGCICIAPPLQPIPFYSFVDQDNTNNGISSEESNLPKGGIMN